MIELFEAGEGFSRESLIAAIKDLGLNYKFDKYSDQQLYRILNKAQDTALKDPVYNLINDDNTALLLNSDDKKLKDYEWISNYNGYDIFINPNNNSFIINGINFEFPTESEAVEYIEDLTNFDFDDNISDYFEEYIPEHKKKDSKHAMGWFTRFNTDPEKGIEVFNHNMKHNDSVITADNVSTDTSSTGTDSAVGGAE